MKNVITLLFLTISFFQCSNPSESISNNPVAVGRVFNAAFLISEGVYNSELMAPYDIFQHTVFHTEGGIKVFTVAQVMDTVRTFEGINILPDYSFGSSDLPKIDILVVPSAEHHLDTDLENEILISFVKETGQNAEYVMSLCDGAFVLATAGLVKGKKSTTFPSDIPAYKKKFPSLDVIDKVSFVHDGKLLTSAGGAKSYDVALYLVEHLYGTDVAKGVGKGLVIDWDLKNYKYKVITSQ